MKCPNLCFEKNPDEISDMLNGCDGINLQDVNGGVIGLGRIVASLQASVSNLQKDNKSAEKAVQEVRKILLNHERHITVLQRGAKHENEMDSKFTVDELSLILETFANARSEEGDLSTVPVAMKAGRLKGIIDNAVKRHNGKKEDVNIQVVVW